MKKRIIAGGLSCLIFVMSFFTFVQIEKPSFAIDLGVLQNKMISRFGTSGQFSEAQNADARSFLEGELSSTVYKGNKRFYYANVGIMLHYGKVVYTESKYNTLDFKGMDDQMKDENGDYQYRYLGYRQDCIQKVTNTFYPNLAGSSDFFTTYMHKNWFEHKEENANGSSWDNVHPDIVNYMLTSDGIAVQDGGAYTQGTENNPNIGKRLSIADVFYNITGGNYFILKNLAIYMSSPSLKYWGSIKGWHKIGSSRYYRSIDIDPIPFADLRLEIVTDEAEYTFAEDEQEKTITGTATVHFDNFQKLTSSWMVGDYIRKASINVGGVDEIATVGPNSVYRPFSIKVNRNQLKTGEWQDFKINGGFHLIAQDHFNKDEFSGNGSGTAQILVNPGQVDPSFDIVYMGDSVKDGTIPVKSWQDFNLTLEPTINIYGENEVANVMWVFESSGVDEMKFGNNSISYLMNESKKDSHLIEGTATFKMYTYLKHPIKVNGSDTDLIIKSGTVDFIQDEEPITDPNIPPTARVKAPNKVRVGDKFKFSGARSIAGSKPIEEYNFSAPGLKTVKMYDDKSGQGVFLSGSSKELSLEVTDTNGLSDTSKTDITLIDALEADFEVYGDRRVYRIVEFDGSKSTDAYYYPLEEGDYKWSLAPLENQADDSYVILDSNGSKKIHVLFLDEGAYNVTLEVSSGCTYPSSSRIETDSVTHPITIQPDLKPVANFAMTQFVLRDRMDGGQATIEMYDSSFSPDNDKYVVDWYITKDEDNDGLEGDETYTKVSDNQLASFFKTAEVGNYYAYNVVTEIIPDMMIVAPYIPANAAKSDNSKDLTLADRTALVENVAPIISSSAELQKEVDLLVITDEDGSNYSSLVSEVDKLTKSMYERKFGVNHNIVNLNTSVPKVTVGSKKEQTFNWHRKWYLDAKWSMYRNYDRDRPERLWDQKTKPYSTLIYGGIVESNSGTYSDMLDFQSYPQAYGELSGSPYVDRYRTNGGRVTYNLRNLDVNVYNAPYDFLGKYRYTHMGYGGEYGYNVASESTGYDWTARFNTTKYENIEYFYSLDYNKDYPAVFYPNSLTPVVDSNWKQGNLISEEDQPYSVPRLESLINKYVDSQNDKYIIFAIADGRNLYLPDEVRRKLTEEYGFKVYFSIDEFWGEFSPKPPKVVNVKFQDNALYGQTQYGNLLENKSDTVVENMYFKYLKKNEREVDFTKISDNLSTLSAKTSGYALLRRYYAFAPDTTYFKLDEEGTGRSVYEHSDGKKYGSEMTLFWVKDYWEKNYSSTDTYFVDKYDLNTEWTLNSGQVIPKVEKIYAPNQATMVAQTIDGSYFISHDVDYVNRNDSMFKFQKGIKLNLADLDEVYYVDSNEINTRWTSRFYSNDEDQPHRGSWMFRDKKTPIMIVRDVMGQYAVCYTTSTYSTPYSSDVRYLNTEMHVVYISDLSQFIQKRYEINVGRMDWMLNFYFYPQQYHQIKSAKWYISAYNQLMSNKNNANYYYGQLSEMARDFQSSGSSYSSAGQRIYSYNNHIDDWAVIDNSGNLYINGKYITSGVSSVDIEHTNNGRRIVYAKNGVVYGKGITEKGQLGSFTELTSYQPVFNSPYTLNASESSTDFASVFDITSSSPKYKAVNRGLYSIIMDDIEAEYDDYTDTETVLIQVGDSVDISGFVLDYEGDPIYQKFIDVTHDNTYFDNADTPWTPPSDFDKPVVVDTPGRMLVGLGAIDNPIGNDERFANFRYRNKNNTRIELIVHRPPIADLGLAIVPQGHGGFMFVGSSKDSYDLDHSKSRPDKGIIESKYYYKKELEATWTEFDGTMNIENGIEYQFALRVKDLENAWSDYDIKKIKIEGDPFVLNASIDPAYPTGVPAGTDITIEADVFSYKGIDSVKAVFDANTFQLNQVSHDGMTRTYSGTFTTATSQPDQDYYDVEVSAYAADGSIRQVPLKVNVSTPVNIQGSITPIVIKKGQVGTLSASTSEYVKAVNATLFYGKTYSRTIPMTKGSTKNGLVTWHASYTFNENATEGQYEVQFDGETTNGQRGSHKVNYKFIPNQAPEVAFLNHTPGFVYEGDDVVLNFSLIDPDGGHLDVDVEVYTRSSSSQNSQQGSDAEGSLSLEKAYSEAGVALETNNSTIYQVSVPNAEATDYIIKLVASDPLGEEASTQAQFSAADLSVSGQVRHTQRWNENRIAFNQSKTQTDNAPRTYQHFWPGERFELIAESTQLDENANVTCESVSVEILNRNRMGSLIGNAFSLHFWSGDLWDQDMLEWKDTTLTFRFSAHYSNGRVKTDDVEVILDNSEPYWRIHRLY